MLTVIHLDVSPLFNDLRVRGEVFTNCPLPACFPL